MIRSPLASLAALACLVSACETLPEDGTQAGGACEFAQCPADSTCKLVGGDAFCDCNDGFVGSGGSSASACYPATTDSGTCRDTPDGIACDCNEGFVHERFAVECTPAIVTCDDLSCDPNATCQASSGSASCRCKPGYSGDGATCTKDALPPTCADLTCGANALCQLLAAGPVCSCKPGFEGDGETCTPIAGPVTCADLTCGANATCQTAAAGAECRCNTGYAGDGYVCTPSGEPCPNGCPDGAVCVGQGVESRCECDADHFALGPLRCEPKLTTSGACDVDAAGAITCTCNPGYAHTANAAACSDIDECTIPETAPGGCEAWCTNLEGSATCTSTVADASSPYWADTCDPTFSETLIQTQLIADCRCGGNKNASFGLPLCGRPSSQALRAQYGNGPRMVDIERNLPRVPTGALDEATRKLYLGIGYTHPTDSYAGAIMEIDIDTGDRRIVAGLWPDDFGGTVYGSGIEPYIPEVQNLTFGPDGYLYATVRNVLNNMQIIRVDRHTGAMTRIWAEHVVLQPELNNPAYAQCSNGASDGRTWVQIHERGFLVEPSGAFLLAAMAPGAGSFLGPTGIVRISADGSTCTWVRRHGAAQDNAFFNQNVGSGAAPQPGIPYRAFYAHDGMIWAIDNFARVYRLDPNNDFRTQFLEADLGEDWMAWDQQRGIMWFSGVGGGANMISAYVPDDAATSINEETAFPLTCTNPSMPGFGCANGPLETCCLNHLPVFYDSARGNLILQHDIVGTVRLEIETGNSYTFSL